MKIRDTALSNEGRAAAGRWLKALREARSLSQSDLAAQLDEKHYTFISQIETGRRSVPTFHIDKLAKALSVPRDQFAKELLSHQDPFLYSALFGDERGFSELVRQLTIDDDKPAFSLEEPLLSVLSKGGEEGLSLARVQDAVQKSLQRELHYQSVSQALRRLEKTGRVSKSPAGWKIMEKI